jgi:lysophospholipase L1-like esterase
VVGLQFSTNEQSLLESPAEFVDSYRTLISWIPLAAPNADIILTTDPDTANTINPVFHPTSEYAAAIRNLATELHVGFLDFCAHIGPYAPTLEAGLYDDTVHVSPSGGQRLAEFVLSYLNRECGQQAKVNQRGALASAPSSISQVYDSASR